MRLWVASLRRFYFALHCRCALVRFSTGGSRDFPLDECAPVAYSFVGRARSAFAEIIKAHSLVQLGHLYAELGRSGLHPAAQESAPLVLRHVQDAASLRRDLPRLLLGEGVGQPPLLELPTVATAP